MAARQRRRAWRILALASWAFAGAACDTINNMTAPPDAQQAMADLTLGPSDLKIVGAVDRADRTYHTGKPIVLSVEVNRPAYVAVLRVLPSGDTTIVFPNRLHPSAQVAADKPLRIPDAGSPLQIAAARPGSVLFEFIAASRGTSWLFTRKPQGSADFAELGATTRALAKDIFTSLHPGPGLATAATHLTIEVEGD